MPRLSMALDYAVGQCFAQMEFLKRDRVGCDARSRPVTGSRSSNIL
jgi:hypothetical protein